MAGDTPVLPVALTGIGLYLAWFGVHYWSSDVKWPSDPVKAVLTGKPVPDNTRASPTADSLGIPATTPAQVAQGTAGSVAIGEQIAAKAQTYVGAGYVWGGYARFPGDWDCSSFVSKVLGQDFGLALPGGGGWGDPGNPPGSHGPGSTAYMLYGTGIDLSQVRAGDLVVSTEHIGIAISPTQMVSAQQPSTGTQVSGFPAGFPGGPPVYRRPVPDVLQSIRVKAG